MNNYMFEKVAILGLGLMGSSIARALKEYGISKKIAGWDRDEDCVNRGLKIGFVDIKADDIQAAVRECELIILSVPVGSMLEVLRKIDLKQQIITDVGSVKRSFVDDVKVAYGKVPPRAVPGHPVAGSEKKGMDFGRSDLFLDNPMILTPQDNCDQLALKTVKEMWVRMGSRVSVMSVEEHDSILTYTSHLPHLLASVLSEGFYEEENREILLNHAGGGFRDVSRIAASDPDIWADIFMANRDMIFESLDKFLSGIEKMKGIMASERHGELKVFLGRAKLLREQFSARDQES